MKTKSVTLYKFSELSEEAQEKAIQHERDARANDPYTPWMDEIGASFKAVFKATSGVTLKDWSFGAYNRGNMARVEFDQEEVGELTGARAMTWLENNLFGTLRSRVGSIPDCPLTGYCADEDFLDELRKDARSGRVTLKDSFQGLADVAARLMENEVDNYTSEETIREYLENNDAEEFLENGSKE